MSATWWTMCLDAIGAAELSGTWADLEFVERTVVLRPHLGSLDSALVDGVGDLAQLTVAEGYSATERQRGWASLIWYLPPNESHH